MLTRIQEQLGLKGFGRVLLDSFEPDEFDRLVEECGLESPEKDSDERKALGLANLISSWPQLAAEVTRLLDAANREVRERIEGLEDETLLNQFSPQNAEMEVPPGRLVWALLRCGDRPACQSLLRIWVDFLIRLAPASSDAPETHAIDEKNVLEAERLAVARYAAAGRGESQEAPDEALRPRRGRTAEEKVAPGVHPDRVVATLDSLEESDKFKPPVSPVEEESGTAEPQADRDEPGLAGGERPASIEPPEAETGIFPSAVADPEADRTIEALPERVLALQGALESQLGRLESRIDQIEDLSLSLQREIETVTSGEQQRLTLKLDQVAAALAAVREQTRMIRSRLEKIPSMSRPEAEGAGLTGPMEKEEPSSPEEEESGAERPAEDSSAPSLFEARPAEPESAGTGVFSAEATGHSEERPGEVPALSHGEGQDEERAETAGPGWQEAPSAPAPGGCEPPVSMPPIEPIFQSETIILVGGHDHLAAEYEALIEGLGGRFERYPSVDEFSLRWLEDLAERAYLVIAFGNVVTQRGVLSLMEVANRLGRRFFVHHSAAPTSLHQFLLRLVEGETI